MCKRYRERERGNFGELAVKVVRDDCSRSNSNSHSENVFTVRSLTFCTKTINQLHVNRNCATKFIF